MSMKDYFDVLENADDNTVETIEQKYPVLDEEQTEKILRMSLKKMQTANKNDDNVATVKNVHEYHAVPVEPDRRPIWHHVTGLVAAAAIVAGGVTISRNWVDFYKGMTSDVSSGNKENSSVATDITTTTSSTTSTTTSEAENSALTEEEITEIAKETLLKYGDFFNVFLIHDNIDLSDVVSLNTDPPVNYYRFADDRFDNKGDLTAYAKTIFEADYFWENYNFIGRDLTSEILPDDSFSYSIQELFWSESIPVFINLDGILYAYYFDINNLDLNNDSSFHKLALRDYITTFEWKDEEETVDIIDENTFVVTKDYLVTRDMTACTERVSLTVNKSEDGLWLIGDVETETLEKGELQQGINNYDEYIQIAKDLTDKYGEIEKFWQRGTEYDVNDVIQFNLIPSDKSAQYLTDEEYQQAIENYAVLEFGTYYRNTDERFQSVDDIENFIRSVVSEEWADIMVEQHLTDCFAGHSPGDEVKYTNNEPRFLMYDGKLYVQGFVPQITFSFDHWTNTPIKICGAAEDRFTIEREWTDATIEEEESEATQIDRHVDRYLIVKDPATGEWRIGLE